MALYNFALTLAGVSADTKGLEDVLSESGCDDALICFYGKSVYLEFDRERDSFCQAVFSAIRDIERAPLGATVLSVDANLVGLSDIAELSDMSRQAIAMLKDGTRGSGDFPGPVQRIKGISPLWRWADVAKWLNVKGKLDAERAVNARQLDIINLALQLRETQERDNIDRYLAILQQPQKLADFCLKHTEPA